MTQWTQLDEKKFQLAMSTWPYNDHRFCQGMLVCTECGTLTPCYQLKEEESPITKPEENDNMDLGQHYDKTAKSGGGKFKRRPFLKAKDIPEKTGATAKIIDFREAPKQMEYSDFLCDVAIGKKEYTWGLKSQSVTLNMLIDELGKRTEKWIGKTVKLVRAGNKGQYVNLA